MSLVSGHEARAGLVLVIALSAGALLWQPWSRPLVSLAQSHAGASAGARPSTQVKRLSCEPLADMPGKVVTTLQVDFPPNGYTPAHRHPGAVTAIVLSGQVRSQMQGLPAQTYRAGQTWFEPSRELHLFAENPSASEPARLLAVIVSDEHCGPLVIPEPTAAHRH
ncbi:MULTISPECIES: cupin domain-containing protein [Pseudomonadaceae]|uniref:Cupin domain-containing protein n=1 Tax=Pseudomonas denitrificans TaxID=43306 RepID=A0A9X7N2H5_PSEDE|nr:MULTISPECIES: cupin domain-containing protein [Pseudomonadaceae]MBD9515756.1 cupin domain-containing protein [Pseudomonas sp. PDM22]MBD9679134.1 cupin domain-containing protein [Pseudomonas sp. PDM18]OQR38492.1 cupin 2 conserved barrel domain protein [Pseudomonas sp. T]QEY73770.1 cupin domain-containing protein [Pseudomonas denitrificans (nom. rej.)]